MVQEMAAAWRSKREKGRRGKAMKLFHSFCSSLDSHKSLMKLLPEGNAYVSVFMGSLGAIIKVGIVSTQLLTRATSHPISNCFAHPSNSSLGKC